MKKNNLIDFIIVGKTVKDRKYCLSTFSAFEKGWKQRSSNPVYNLDYINNETIDILLDWMKIDFSNYRMFESDEEAQAYLKEKTTKDNHSSSP